MSPTSAATALDPVGQQQGEERRVIQVLRARQREAFGQLGQQQAELEAFEEADQISDR